MKKRFLGLILMCVLLFLISGCFRETPKYLPGENEGDYQFVWVCEKPFAFFYPTYNYEDYWKTHNEYNKEEGYPIEESIGCGIFEGVLKGYVEKDGELVRFYSGFYYYDQTTYFYEEKNWGDPSKDEKFSGCAYYYENHFELEIGYDPANFFGGELPELRFDKVTKEEFLEKYGDIENLPESLELELYDLDTLSTEKSKV